MELPLQLLWTGVINAALAATFALAFGIFYHSTRIFHIAFGSIAVSSAFGFWFMVEKCHLPIAFAGCVVLVGSGCIGALVNSSFYSTLSRRGASSAHLLVCSLALGLIIENALALLWGNEVHLINRPPSLPIPFVAPRVTVVQLEEFIACSLIIALVLWVGTAKKLRPFTVLSSNPELLAIHGWNVTLLRAAACAAATAIAATPAMFTIYDVGLDVHAGFALVVPAALGVLIGGRSRVGWVIGGALLGFLQAAIAWKLPTRWASFFVYGTLLAIAMWRDRGLFVPTQRAEESQ